MFRYIIGVLILIAGALSFMVWGIGVPEIYQEALPEHTIPHTIGTVEQSIEEIEIFAFYFVPKNKKEKQIAVWHDLLEKHLKKLVDFHALQFQDRSHITYKIYPKVVVGLEDNIVYDTNSTQNGNPQALIHIAEELETRVFKQEGDLYDVKFVERGSSAYPVMAIFYEGVGASGGIIHNSELETAGEIAEELELPESTVFILDIEAVEGFFIFGRRTEFGRYKSASA